MAEKWLVALLALDGAAKGGSALRWPMPILVFNLGASRGLDGIMKAGEPRPPFKKSPPPPPPPPAAAAAATIIHTSVAAIPTILVRHHPYPPDKGISPYLASVPLKSHTLHSQVPTALLLKKVPLPPI